MAPMAVKLNDLEGHSPVSGLFKCNSTAIYAALYKISIESVCLCGPSASADLLVTLHVN